MCLPQLRACRVGAIPADSCNSDLPLVSAAAVCSNRRLSRRLFGCNSAARRWRRANARASCQVATAAVTAKSGQPNLG